MEGTSSGAVHSQVRGLEVGDQRRNGRSFTKRNTVVSPHTASIVCTTQFDNSIILYNKKHSALPCNSISEVPSQMIIVLKEEKSYKHGPFIQSLIKGWIPYPKQA